MAKARTVKQKAALRKAQLASARKRRKGGKMSPRQHRRSSNKESYGSRRKGITKTQYKNRVARRKRRVGKAIVYGSTAAYVGVLAYTFAPVTTRVAVHTVKTNTKNLPANLKRTAKYGRSNYQFNKIMKANGMR